MTFAFQSLGRSALPLLALFIEPAGAQETRTEAPASPASAPSASPTTTLEPVVVKGGVEAARGYLPIKPSAAGNKLELELREQANVVNVVPRQLLEDTGATTVHQALETVAGIRPVAPAYTSVSTGIRSRGFESNDTFINGIRLGAFGHGVDTANIEQLEVLKGPASIQYGLADPGGTLNIVTKRPTATPLARARVIGGSFDSYRAELDVGGPVGEGRTLLTRLNLAAEDSKEHRDFDQRRLFLFAPAATLALGPSTTWDVELNVLDSRFFFNRGLPPFPFILGLPRKFMFEDPALPLSHTTSVGVFSTLEHALGDSGWKLRQRLGTFRTDGDIREVNSDYDSIDPATPTPTVARTYYDTYQRDRYTTLQHELAGEFFTAGIKHKLLVGTEWSKTDFGYGFYSSPDPALNPAPLDVGNPSYGGFRFPARSELGDGGFPPEHYGNYIAALYTDWHMTPSPQWKLQAGLRYDRTRGYYKALEGPVDYGAGRSKGLSPRAGVVWTPLAALDLFANYSSGFVPQIFADSAGTLFTEPEASRQLEAGLRYEFVPGRLRGTAAVYTITKKNVQVPDPADPTGQRNRLSGEQKSSGFELELAGAITPRWDLSAGFARVNARVTKDTIVENIGTVLVDAPRNHFALFTKLKLPQALQNWWVGYGLARVSERSSSSFNPSFLLPAYTRHDLSLGWIPPGSMSAQLNLGNVTDERVYYSHGNNIHLQPGRNLRLTLDYRFR